MLVIFNVSTDPNFKRPELLLILEGQNEIRLNRAIVGAKHIHEQRNRGHMRMAEI